MFYTDIVWHKTAEELPAKSGTYLAIYSICFGRPSIMTMGYSSKHKCFNAHDYEDEPANAIHSVIYWAECPTVPECESEDE